jgi:hypothetical protein
MKIYHYHPEYKYFTYDGDANLSPEDPNVYLIPAYATDIEPPSCEEGYIQVFDETSWDIIEDNRGQYWNKETLLCHNIENPCTCCNNLTKEIPPFESRLPNQVIKWNDGWVIEDIPNPEPPTQEIPLEQENPYENMSPAEKISAIGLTVEDLKSLLGMTP